MNKLTIYEKRKLKDDILKLNKFQWNKIKDMIDLVTSKYTVKTDGLYIRLNILDDQTQNSIKDFVKKCLIQKELISNNDILKNINNDLLTNELENDNIKDLKSSVIKLVSADEVNNYESEDSQVEDSQVEDSQVEDSQVEDSQVEDNLMIDNESDNDDEEEEIAEESNDEDNTDTFDIDYNEL
jgi:hypothetical protein